MWKTLLTILKGKKIDTEQVFKDQYLKIKIKSYNNKVTSNFKNVDNDNNEIPKKELHTFDCQQ